MEFKINQGAIDQSSLRRRNNIFRRFRRQFQALLSQTRNRQTFSSLDKIYIENTSIHEQLGYFMDDEQNLGQFLVGLTGIGKTTTLKGFFGIDGSSAKIANKIMVLAVFVDGASIYKKEDIEERLGAMFWNGCKELDPNLQYEKRELYDYIYSNSAQTLGRFEDPNNPKKEVTIDNLISKSPRSFYLELLKFYFRINDISSVVLIVDDIDSIKDNDLLSEFVHLSAKSWECLQNNESGVYVKLLISERPETHYNLFRDASWFTAFGFQEDPIDLNEPPSLSDIFEKRFDYISAKDTSSQPKDKEEWKIAHGVLMDICNDLSIRNQNVLLCLCNYNVRKAFAILLELLTAGFWLQKDEAIRPYFKLRKGQFRKPSSILVLKALGYKNNEYYINSKPQLLSNLLHYRRGCTYPLLGLQIVRCFLVENEKNEGRFAVLSKQQLLSMLKKAITPQPNRSLEEAVDYTMGYLLKKKHVLVSSLDSGDEDKLYLSPKGESSWDLMGENSVLLELFRDDMWLDGEHNRGDSVRFLPPDEKFGEIVNLAEHLLEEEMCIVKELISAKSISVYQELFGDLLVTSHISSGVIESVRRFYQITETEMPTDVKENLHKLISDADSLMAEYLEV